MVQRPCRARRLHACRNVKALDTRSFHDLADSIARYAPLTPSQAHVAVEIARIVAAARHAESPEQRAALDTLIYELAWVSGTHVTIQPDVEHLAALVESLTCAAAGELAFTAAAMLMAADADATVALANLRRSLAISEPRARELVALAAA